MIASSNYPESRVETLNIAHYDCIVIGGGAAGLMCAAAAGARGRSVLVIESSNKVGKKILMSGGGRCNFTNYAVEPENYLCANKHFCKSALSRYTQWDFIALVERHAVAYHEKTLGQLFCDNKSKDILQMLLAECDAVGVQIVTDETVSELGSSNAKYRCQSLVIATGGLSIPTLGASGYGYDIAKQFALKVTAKHASLVPFTFKGELLKTMQSLAGVALPVNIAFGDAAFKEALLFTHKGLSGPAALQASNYWWPGEDITIDFLPDLEVEDVINEWQNQKEKAMVRTLLSQILPKRFVSAWLGQTSVGEAILNKTPRQISNGDFAFLNKMLKAWSAIPAGTEGYGTAEVTRGGVNTDEVSSKTFESKKVEGLYFVGEVLDVTGWLGGYNFQWAWASGHCAAQYV
jgi:predicted Rossmann fold flavoprotein